MIKSEVTVTHESLRFVMIHAEIMHPVHVWHICSMYYDGYNALLYTKKHMEMSGKCMRVAIK